MTGQHSRRSSTLWTKVKEETNFIDVMLVIALMMNIFALGFWILSLKDSRIILSSDIVQSRDSQDSSLYSPIIPYDHSGTVGPSDPPLSDNTINLLIAALTFVTAAIGAVFKKKYDMKRIAERAEYILRRELEPTLYGGEANAFTKIQDSEEFFKFLTSRVLCLN